MDNLVDDAPRVTLQFEIHGDFLGMNRWSTNRMAGEFDADPLLPGADLRLYDTRTRRRNEGPMPIILWVSESMSAVPFNRDHQATWYGRLHLGTDPGVREVHYLPQAPDREIRLIEVNELMPAMRDDCLEPLELGMDHDQSSAHRLLIMDVTPSQWEKIKARQIPLPEGWSLDGIVSIPRPSP